MRSAFAPAIVAAALAAALGAAAVSPPGASSAPGTASDAAMSLDAKAERPAPPDRFVVETAEGRRLSGAPARIDIRHLDALQAPQIEVTVSAGDDEGQVWGFRAWAPSSFPGMPGFTAHIVRGPLGPGQAGVEHGRAAADTRSATGGTLQLALREGRLTGRAHANGASARFEGPYAVSCAVPASAPAAAASAATPTPEAPLPVLVVDERFESPLCKPYAQLAGVVR